MAHIYHIATFTNGTTLRATDNQLWKHIMKVGFRCTMRFGEWSFALLNDGQLMLTPTYRGQPDLVVVERDQPYKMESGAWSFDRFDQTSSALLILLQHEQHPLHAEIKATIEKEHDFWAQKLLDLHPGESSYETGSTVTIRMSRQSAHLLQLAAEHAASCMDPLPSEEQAEELEALSRMLTDSRNVDSDTLNDFTA